MRWVTDDTRTRFQITQHTSLDDAAKAWHRQCRRDLWHSRERLVKVWCESNSIAGTINQTVYDYGLALLPARGQSGKRFVWDSAQAYGEVGKPVTVIYVGDYDPAGLLIAGSVRRRLLTAAGGYRPRPGSSSGQ